MMGSGHRQIAPSLSAFVRAHLGPMPWCHVSSLRKENDTFSRFGGRALCKRIKRVANAAKTPTGQVDIH
jgi:hypothetical protein